jgi:hypothetical protein
MVRQDMALVFSILIQTKEVNQSQVTTELIITLLVLSLTMAQILLPRFVFWMMKKSIFPSMVSDSC